MPHIFKTKIKLNQSNMKKLMVIMFVIEAMIASAQCKYARNETDEFSGIKIQATESEELTSRTPDGLKKYYPSDDYLKIKVSVARFDSSYVIYFNATIKTENAYKYYGSLREGSKIIFKHDSTHFTTCNISKTDVGDTDYKTERTDYATYIKLDKEQLKSLREMPVAKIRLYWSNGYEDYEVKHPQCLVNLLKCI